MRYRKIGMVTFYLTIMITISAQMSSKYGSWKGQLIRADGNNIPFHFTIQTEKNKTVMYVVNAAERIRVDNIRFTKDSVFIEMPVFESYFKARVVTPRSWEGQWTKGGSLQWLTMPFAAELETGKPAIPMHDANENITGKWEISFTRPDKTTRPAVGEWVQKGNLLTGTIITPSGDYRYLSGFVSGDSLELGTFDGSHAYYFKAKIKANNRISNGQYYSGATSIEPWIAFKNANVRLPDVGAMRLKSGEERLSFKFADLHNQMVSINDSKFKNKVVIVQIMGSWCPNCMDETAFLSEYYKQNKQRGIEVIGLAYEYTTDRERSIKSMRKFKDRFDVQYPLLYTGVTVLDSLKTEKTLPQLTPIKFFPTTIFIDKKGKVVKIHAGFEGPGTGLRYEEFKKEFGKIVDGLLKE